MSSDEEDRDNAVIEALVQIAEALERIAEVAELAIKRAVEGRRL